MLENTDSQEFSLNGEWQFRLNDSPPILIPVPSAWEAHTADKLGDAATYTRAFHLSSTFIGARILLECDAISFDATIRLNDQLVGSHRGMWSPFQFDVTSILKTGENKIEIDVVKPGKRFPLRETLAGFLPDVCTTFGGIWQGIRLRTFANAAFHDLKIFARRGWVDVQGGVEVFSEQKTKLHVQLKTPQVSKTCEVSGDTFAAHIELPEDDEARNPLSEISLSLFAGSERLAHATRTIGLRDLKIQNEIVTLNNQPLHLRGVLDWGWNPNRLCPTPTRDELFQSFAKARSLGFNLIKLCLFVPDETTFDVADDTGMMLWLEIPMWLPRLTPEVKELARREYHDLFQRLHHHPSIVVLSLGCELNAEANAEFLNEFNDLARLYFPNALHCDNSGSAEAYGGVATQLSDFYDYHFYADPHFFQPLVEHFTRSYQPRKPWLYGEFCDADTFRDFSLLDRRQQKPVFSKKTGFSDSLLGDDWWLTQPTHLDRDDFLAMRDYKNRLRAANISDNGKELTRVARKQATAIRKYIVEQVRKNSAAGGYVISGWMDTPITTSGIVDDQLNLKFDPREWTQFNNDRVLTLDRERRRRWIGGDRPAYKDPFCWWAGESAEIHLALSNGGEEIRDWGLKWEVRGEKSQVIAEGEIDGVDVQGGEVKEIAVLHFKMLMVEKVTEFVLRVEATHPKESPLQNEWKLFVFPNLSLPKIALHGSFKHHHHFDRLDKNVSVDDGSQVVISDTLDEALLAEVRQGRRALLWQATHDDRFTRSLPFWREAIHIFPDHTLWTLLPHPQYADMRFFSVASDVAIDVDRLSNVIGAKCESVWRRFDARQMFWSEYVVEAKIGDGILLATTLKLEGGSGSQPETFETNPMGSFLLASIVEMIE